MLLIAFCRISRHSNENKMSLHNLATVFGPTLLQPAVKAGAKAAPLTMENSSENAKQAMAQTAILLLLLQLRQRGCDITGSS